MKEYVEALEELVELCKAEFKRGREAYGDSWKRMSIDSLLGVVINDANKLEVLRDPAKLRHRFSDIVNYIIFCVAKLETTE